MRRGSWSRRLVLTQFAVLVTMAFMVAGTALVVGPVLFDRHMVESRHDEPVVVAHAEQAFRAAGLVSLAVGLAGALVVAAFSAWVLNRSLARGLDALVEGAARVAGGDYDHPVQMPPATAELERVAAEFNNMADQVAHTEVTRRRLLTDLGHELRTPLAATRVTLEGLEDGVVDFTPETLGVLQRQNQRLEAVAADISEVSRAEEGRIPLDLRRVAVDDVARAATTAFLLPCQPAGVSLQVDLGAGDAARADIDPARIGQVLDNLLRNALQHTSAGDTIRVSSRVDDGHVDVTVADTGVGISAEALPHLFERFYRAADSRTRDQDGGTGVGLAIARAIARAHGGTLDAASDGPGAGATFRLRLPLVS